jgi:hypothetical protein
VIGTLDGDVPERAVQDVRGKVLAVAGRSCEPVLFAKVKLTQGRDPAVRRSAMAQANLDVNGRPARAHVAAPSMPEAVNLLRDRLEHRLARLSRGWEARRGGMPQAAAHEWRHTSESAHRPDFYPRPPEDRRVVRHKSFSLARETPDEAAFEMEAMDYDFHLFTDLDTGRDSVIYRAGPTGYRLAQVGAPPDGLGPTAVPLTLSAVPARSMTQEQAQRWLETTGYPFVFYADATGRGTCSTTATTGTTD